MAASVALSIPARANDVFSADVFASNDPHRDFEVEIMSYDELMAQTPTVRATYLKNLQGMYLQALEIEAKNPHVPDAIGSNSKIEKMFTLLEAFSNDAQAMGGGGASSNGRNIKTLGDQFQEDTDALAAAQKAFDRCQATPKPTNCGTTVMRNLQVGLDASKKAYDETAAKIKVSKEQSAQVKAAQDKLAEEKASAARIAARPADSAVPLTGPAADKAMEATRVAREAYITAKQNYDNCVMRPVPSECTIPETNRRKGAMERAEKDYEAANAKMPSDPRSEPNDAPTRPGQPNADAMAAAHSKVVSCRKDTAPVTCTKPDTASAAGKARDKKIADYERKSATQKSCTTGFLNSNLSGSCKNVSSLKVGTLELKCKPATTMCNPWMYGASSSGSGVEAICGDVPAKGTNQQKAVEIAKSCGEKSGKVKNAVDNFLANSKITGIKEGWDAKIRQPLNQLCGGPLRMEANCEICQKLASDALLSISRSGAIRKCDAVSGAGAQSHSTVK